MDLHQSNHEKTKLMDKKIECVNLNQDNKGSFNGHIEKFNQQIIAFEQRSNYSLEEIEEVYGKIEEERQNINHILEIKELLLNSENVTETEITVWLQMLALIVVSSEDLMVTDIGMTVSGLLLHWSKKVIREAKRLVKKFKRIIEDKVDENAELSSAKAKGQDPPTILDEHVLFNPPMDEGFSIGNIPDLDFTTFFEDIDDNGNLIIHNCEGKEFHESQVNPSRENNTELTGSASINTIQKQKQKLINKLISRKNHTTPLKKIEMSNEGHRCLPITERKLELALKQDPQTTTTKKRQKHVRREQKFNKISYNRPSDTQLSLQRFAKQRQQIDCNNDDRKTKKNEHKVHQVSNVGPRLHSRGASDDAVKIEEKLETSKRKLHEGYQAHERDRRRTRYLEGYECDFVKDNSRRSSRPSGSNRRRYN